MRQPKLNEFYDETTDTYDYEEYQSVCGDYADSERDRKIEEQWEQEDADHENRTNSE